MKKHFLKLCFCGIFFLRFFIQAKEASFIISENVKDSKEKSKNELKENIGIEIKNSLHYCTELNKQIGKIQIELSKIQKQLFEKIEELIDNKHPFKKASRTDLIKSSNMIKSVKNELVCQIERVKKIDEFINKDKCLKKTSG